MNRLDPLFYYPQLRNQLAQHVSVELQRMNAALEVVRILIVAGSRDIGVSFRTAEFDAVRAELLTAL